MNHLWIGLLLVLFMAARQLQSRPIKRSLYTLPLLILGYGIYLCSGAGVQTGEGISLVLAVALGAAAGWLQGRFTRVFQLDGVWMIAGSYASVAIWLISVPIRYLVHFAYVRAFDIPVVLIDSYAFVPFLFSIAGILLGRTLYLTAKYPNEFIEGASTSRWERRQARRASKYRAF